MKARLMVHQEFYSTPRWEWRLIPYRAHYRLDGCSIIGASTYADRRGARRAALRWAKRLGLKVEGER